MIEFRFATVSDFSSCMELVRLVSLNFPGLETKGNMLEYEKTLFKNINCFSLIYKTNSTIAGWTR